MSTPYATVITTCGTRREAEMIAERLVGERLAACVQMLAIDSMYRWQGEIEKAGEWLLLCKVRASDYSKVEAEIRKVHSYKTPEIIEIAIENGAADYLDWIRTSTGR